MTTEQKSITLCKVLLRHTRKSYEPRDYCLSWTFQEDSLWATRTLFLTERQAQPLLKDADPFRNREFWPWFLGQRTNVTMAFISEDERGTKTYTPECPPEEA